MNKTIRKTINLIVYLMIIVICVSAFSCKQKTEINNILKSKNKIVYIEARSDDGITAGNFGDVVVMDLSTKEKYFITDDSFYDVCPSISNNNRFIAFASAREGSRKKLFVEGIGAQQHLYLYNTESRSIEKIKIDTKDSKKRISYYENIQWVHDSLVLLFTNSLSVYTLEISNSSLKLLKNFDEFAHIGGVALSPDNKNLALEYDKENQLAFGIAIYNLTDSSIKYISDLRPRIGLGGWSANGQKIIYIDSLTLCEYDFVNNSIKRFDLGHKNLNMEIPEFGYIDSRKIIMILYSVDTKKEELALYDLQTDSLEFITHDGLEKRNLSIYSETHQRDRR